jgi:hypothetical protein
MQSGKCFRKEEYEKNGSVWGNSSPAPEEGSSYRHKKEELHKITLVKMPLNRIGQFRFPILISPEADADVKICNIGCERLEVNND